MSAFQAEHVGSIPITRLAAQIAQLVEQRTENPRVTGSIPVLGIQDDKDSDNIHTETDHLLYSVSFFTEMKVERTLIMRE